MFYTYTEEEAVFWGGGEGGKCLKTLPEEVVLSALIAHHWTHLLTVLPDEDTMGGLLAPHPLHNSGEKPQNSDSNLGMTTHVGFSQSRGNFSNNQFKQQYPEKQQC